MATHISWLNKISFCTALRPGLHLFGLSCGSGGGVTQGQMNRFREPRGPWL